MALPKLVIATVVLAAACVAEPSPTPEPSPSPLAEESVWGPMAVVADSILYINQASGGEGVVEISEHCVVLHDRGLPTVLVWRAGQAIWDPSRQAILFTDIRNLREFFLDGGMRIAVGGRGTFPDDDDNLPPELWVQRPHPSCPDDTFNVHNVTVLAP